MAADDWCTEEEIAQMVRTFYGRVREDPVLGPIFAARVSDWNQHFDRLSDFWSSVLLGTGRFSGTPMATHLGLPHLDAALFERWLALFRETTDAQPNCELATRAQSAAARIAQSLLAGYQSVHGAPGAAADYPQLRRER